MTTAKFVRGASLEAEVEFALAALFRGVPLDDAAAARARSIIAECVRRCRAIPNEITERVPSPTGDGGVFIPGARDRTLAFHEERDAKLRLLVSVPEDVARFDANASAQRKRIESIRPPFA